MDVLGNDNPARASVAPFLKFQGHNQNEVSLSGRLLLLGFFYWLSGFWLHQGIKPSGKVDNEFRMGTYGWN